MSAEFEKIVLEKLDELSKDMKETKEKVDNNTKSINNLSLKVDHLDEKVNILDEKVEQLDEKVNVLDEKVKNNTALINNLSLKVEQQGLNFAAFENEFSIKVQALFDSFVSNTQSHLSYEKSIAVLNAQTYKHDNKISVLEDYFKNAKLLANN